MKGLSSTNANIIHYYFCRKTYKYSHNMGYSGQVNLCSQMNSDWLEFCFKWIFRRSVLEFFWLWNWEWENVVLYSVPSSISNLHKTHGSVHSSWWNDNGYWVWSWLIQFYDTRWCMYYLILNSFKLSILITFCRRQ